MRKVIILLVVLALSLVSVTSAFAVTGPPPPPKGRNCVEVEVDEAFNAMYPPPMGLYTFAACWATPAVKQVCFVTPLETPVGENNFTIRYWQWEKGRWKGGQWSTYNMPTTFSNGEYCVKPVPGLQLYAIQGIQTGPGTWWGLFNPGNWWDED